MFLELTGTTYSGGGEWPVVVNTDHIITFKPYGSITWIELPTHMTNEGMEEAGIYVRESYETIIAALTPYALTVRRAEVAAIPVSNVSAAPGRVPGTAIRGKKVNDGRHHQS